MNNFAKLGAIALFAVGAAACEPIKQEETVVVEADEAVSEVEAVEEGAVE